jgi:PAS domain S-box-containing protein
MRRFSLVYMLALIGLFLTHFGTQAAIDATDTSLTAKATISTLDLTNAELPKKRLFSKREPFNLDQKAVELNKIAQEMQFLDEILTTSVLTYAITTDAKWLEQYQKHVPEQTTIFDKAISHSSNSDLAIIKQINQANDQLVMLETQAIDLTTKGDSEGAIKILNSEVYQRHKEKYSATLAELFEVFEKRFKIKYEATIKKRSVELSADESDWINSHTVKVGVEQWPPIVFTDKKGQFQGLTSGFLKKITESTGLKIEIIADDWNLLLEGLKNKTIDLLPATYYTDERAAYGLYSEPYFTMREFAYIKSDNSEISSFDDLANKRLAIIKGYGTIPKIRAKYPGMTIVETVDMLTSINAVMNGDVDALFEVQMVMEHTIKANSIIGLKGISQTVFKASPVHFFSRIDEPLLQSILQKGLNAITEEEKNKEIGKWISATETERDKLHLSTDELNWLSTHDTFRLGHDSAWPPVEYRDKEGKYAGISSGYIDAVSNRLGVSIQAVPGINWSSAIEKIKVGELDVLSAVARTPEREAFLNFTKPYITIPMIIATHKDGGLIADISDLEGKTVGVVPGYASTELLRTHHPSLKLVEMADIAETLQALSTGKIEAVVESLWSISYEKDRLELDNIKIAAPTPYNYELSMGVRKDWPELVPILDKALSSLDKQETTAIKNAWMAVQVKFGHDMKSILIWAIPAGISAILIILFIVAWNRRLGTEIIERKAAEEELRQSREAFHQQKEMLQTVLLSLTQGVSAFDKDLKLTVWNERFKSLRGYPDNLLKVGADFSDFMRFDAERKEFGEGDVEEAVREKMELARGFPKHNMEQQMPGGRCLEVKGGPISGGGIVTTYTDITERKRAEEKLSFTQYAVDTTVDPVFWINPVDASLKYVNDAACEMLGYSREELLKMHLPDVDKNFTEQKIEEIGAALQVQNSMNFETSQQTIDGRDVNVLVSVNMADYLDRQLLIANVKDISELKEVENQLREARDAAEDATKAKANFLSAMSHEIRTPMNGVVGMIDLLRESRLDEDQLQMVETVKSSAYSLLTIINDILDFSKIEAGKLDLEEIPISIADAVEGVGEALAVTARNKNIQLCVYVDHDIPDGVIGDQVRLRQIIFNLGGNAIKFTEQGKVLIRADRLSSDDDNKAVIRLQVIDDGIGIPEAAQKSLFQAFSQVEASTTRRFGGTGLGLSICQRLTELMGGEIGVESVEGEGSTFHVTVTLPIAEEHKLRSDGEDLEGLRVLLALGDPELRILTPRYLEHWSARTKVIDQMTDVKDVALVAIKDGDPFDVIVVGSSWVIEDQIALIEELSADENISAKFVVACRHRSRKARKELGNTVYVDADPMQRGALIRGVAVAVGRASPDIEYNDSDIAKDPGKAPSVEEAAAKGQLILLAEDNLTNQNVIKRQLDVLGYAVEIANDGVEALELMKTRSYAILLSDCHMPNMDGFDLTKTVRQRDVSTTDHLPIIAVTASVMKEEIDNCFSCGMDDYLMKPLEMDKLRAMLRKWMPTSASNVAEEEHIATTDDVSTSQIEEMGDVGNGPIDPTALKRVFGDDEDTFVEILKEFVEPSSSTADEIETAYAERSADGVAKAAHKLKSSSRSVGANDLADLCQALETAGKADDWDVIDKEAPRLSSTIQMVVEYIDAL